MLDEEFCLFLEYELTKAFAQSTDEEIKNLWCDGILLPTFENEYSSKLVNDKRKVIMTAFTGNSGQDRYELTLHFGSKALSNYSKGQKIMECLPIDKNRDWFEIDIQRHRILIKLD